MNGRKGLDNVGRKGNRQNCDCRRADAKLHAVEVDGVALERGDQCLPDIAIGKPGTVPRDSSGV